MPVADILAKVVQGAAGAAGDSDAQAQVGAWQQQRQQQRQAQQKMALAPLSEALQADQTRLALFANPDDPSKPLAGKEDQYNATIERMRQTIGQMRGIVGEKPAGANPVEAGAGNLLDKLHITNHLKNHVANVRAENAKKYADQSASMAGSYATGAMPFEQTTEGQKLELQEKLRKEASTPKYENVDLGDGKIVAIDTAHYPLPPGAKIVGKTSQSGVPRVIGHTSTQDAMKLLESGAMQYPLANGQNLTAEELKAFPPYMDLTQVRQGDKDIYYPTDQRTHVSTVGNVRYQIPDVGGVVGNATALGEARTPTTTTDPFGVTSTTSPSSPGIGGQSSQPATPSRPSGPVHQKLQHTAATARGTHQLDADGHIPQDAAANPQLVQAANSILDGMDVDKLPVPQRDRAAAMQLAQQYGWKGQGLFTPREVLQLKEGASVIQQMLSSKALGVLDQGTISQLPMLGQGADPSKEGFFGRLGTKLASSAATPDQQEFLRQWRQLDALAVGLRGLVQTGRATQAQVDRIIAELPNPYNTTSAQDAKERLKRVQNELQIAAQTGKLPDVAGADTGNADVDQIVKALSKK